jgi:DNA-binding protein HU-beta
VFKRENKTLKNHLIFTIMKKIILSAAFIAAMMCFGNVYAAKPVKKAAKVEQTTAKKAEKAPAKKAVKKAPAKKGAKATTAKKAPKKAVKATKK